MKNFPFYLLIFLLLCGCGKREKISKQEIFDSCLDEVNELDNNYNLPAKTGFMEQCMLTSDYFFNDSHCSNLRDNVESYEMYYKYECYE